MNTGLAVLVAFALSLLAAGCAGGIPDGRTGVGAVDTVLDAIEADDPALLKPLLKFAMTPCVIDAPIEPVCAEGDLMGTLVRTFLVATCEGTFNNPSDPDTQSDQIVGRDLSLYAVYEAPADLPVAADYVAMFAQTRTEGVAGVGLYIADDRVVGIDEQCGFAPDVLADFLGLGDPLFVPDAR